MLMTDILRGYPPDPDFINILIIRILFRVNGPGIGEILPVIGIRPLHEAPNEVARLNGPWGTPKGKFNFHFVTIPWVFNLPTPNFGESLRLAWKAQKCIQGAQGHARGVGGGAVARDIWSTQTISRPPPFFQKRGNLHYPFAV